jgi:hypothetical protein
MEQPPIKLAFILDGEVADILHTDERLAAIFLSNPIVLDVTEKITEDPNSVRPGMGYSLDNNTYFEKIQEEQ